MVNLKNKDFKTIEFIKGVMNIFNDFKEIVEIDERINTSFTLSNGEKEIELHIINMFIDESGKSYYVYLTNFIKTVLFLENNKIVKIEENIVGKNSKVLVDGKEFPSNSVYEEIRQRIFKN